MDILAHIIGSLAKEEVRNYKLYLSRIQNDDRKDIKLFDHIRKSGMEYNDAKIIEKLYPNGDKNAYYRLRNRIINDLNKCLLSMHFREEEYMYLMNLLTLSRLFEAK